MPTRIEAASTTGLVKTTDLAQSSGSSFVSQDGKVVRLGTNSGVSDTINPLYSQSAYLGGSAAANLLDDYEEGTWSAAEQNGAGVSVTLTQAQYTKIGRTVFIYVDYAFTGSNSNPVSFSSLPFVANSSKDQQFNVYTNVSSCVPQVFAKGSSLNTVKNNATANLLYSDVSGKFLRISGFYQID